MEHDHDRGCGHGHGEGAPNIFIQNMDYEIWGPLPPVTQPDGIHHWAFDVDFGKPHKSTFTDLGLIETPPFDSWGAYVYDAVGISVPQPKTANTLDVLAQMTMTRAQYRSFLLYDTIVGNVATCVLPNGETCTDSGGGVQGGGQIATRWFELRKYRRAAGSCTRPGPGPPTATTAGWARRRWTAGGTSPSATASRAGARTPRCATQRAGPTIPAASWARAELCRGHGVADGGALAGPDGALGRLLDDQRRPVGWMHVLVHERVLRRGIDDCFKGGCWKTQVCSFKLESCGGK